MDQTSRFFMEAAASSSILAGLFFSVFFPESGKAAPYPACCTAWIIASGAVFCWSKSTIMLLVSRLTETDMTPGTFATAFSTWAEQDAQDIPVTRNFCFIILLAPPCHPRGV